MAFQISPGINITEIDRTGVVNQIVSQTTAAYVGKYKWGPVNEITTVRTENELIAGFGYPTEGNYLDFFSAANYLGYGAPLQLIRCGSTASKVATRNGAGFSGPAIWNDEKWESLTNYGSTAATGVTGVLCAKYVGDYGNSLKVSFSDAVEKGITWTAGATLTFSGQIGTIDIGTTNAGKVAVGDIIRFGDSRYQYPVTAVSSPDVSFRISGGASAAETWIDATGTGTILWAYSRYLSYKPSTSAAAARLGYSSDEVAFAVIDEDGLFTGNPGQVLETFTGSKASNGTQKDGSNYYYPQILQSSKYARWISHPEASELTAVTATNNWGSAFNPLGATVAGSSGPYKTLLRNIYGSLNGGVDPTPGASEVIEGFNIFEDSETTESNLFFQGGHDVSVAQYLIDLCETRKDAIAFVSPDLDLVKDQPGAVAAQNVIDWRNLTLDKDSSYGVMDSGWKYQYDKYIDGYRWLPLNPDIAGLCARTDAAANPWFSPAGYNRGQIRNVVKLAFNPSKDLRDDLYSEGINPVFTQSGAGTLLFGDKTLQKKPSAFDRINVRRLFIALEKAVATAAKFQLFEFNDEFTRANFIGLVEPFLRDVQAQRGVVEFKIICDETNNTAEVIENNQFVADIYIKPQRTINYVQLNFIATRTSANFSEIGAVVNL